jgi:hypothetical protein
MDKDPPRLTIHPAAAPVILPAITARARRCPGAGEFTGPGGWGIIMGSGVRPGVSLSVFWSDRMTHKLLLFGIAAAAAAALACGDEPATPASPDQVSSVTTAAAADGSTLKATAPAPYSPLNDVVVSSLTPNLVVANSTLKFLGDVPLTGTLSYRFIVETTAGAAVVNMTAPTTGGSYGALGITGSRVPEKLLAPDTTYRWRARAELGAAFGPWSAYWRFKTPK